MYNFSFELWLIQHEMLICYLKRVFCLMFYRKAIIQAVYQLQAVFPLWCGYLVHGGKAWVRGVLCRLLCC